MSRLHLARARDEARDLLREMIVTRELPPNTHIEEIKISEQIGVSRTPVREALIGLEEEGLVRSSPRKGFVVIGPDEALVREAFPIMAALEATAVRAGGDALVAAAPKMRAINAALARERSRARRYDLDRAFHAALTEPCGNERLLRLLKMERARVQLIDGAHQRGMANLEGSLVEHEGIVAAIERGAFDEAGQLLTQHWHGGIEVVVKWLNQER